MEENKRTAVGAAAQENIMVESSHFITPMEFSKLLESAPNVVALNGQSMEELAEPIK